MILKKFRLEDGMDVFDEFWNGISFSQPTFSYLKGQFVDTDKYDVVPKKSYQEELLKLKESQLKAIKEKHEIREKQLQDEITSLQKALSP